MIPTPDESQRKAAKAVGLSYLLALVPALFAEFYVSDRLIVYDNAAETARNIMANERLFRLGTAANLLVFAIDVVLITALYVVLERVNRNLALLATFYRLIETTMLAVALLNDFNVLRLLSGADYLKVFEADRLQALARLSIGMHGSVYNVPSVDIRVRIHRVLLPVAQVGLHPPGYGCLGSVRVPAGGGLYFRFRSLPRSR